MMSAISKPITRIGNMTIDEILFLVTIMIGGILYLMYPQSYVEILGFGTGLLCVAYIVRENVWNFPIGILNNIFFIILFYQAALFADMGLQVIYIILALIGFYTWMYGGKDKSVLTVTRSTFWELAIVFLAIIIATFILEQYLITVNDSYPFLDALTTCMSLGAQWLLNFKRIENWIIWMSADIIYVWLYLQKNLNLTAVLYVVFFSLCIIGICQWYRSYKESIICTS
jgi:nicotinamide mononucleotide transporter